MYSIKVLLLLASASALAQPDPIVRKTPSLPKLSRAKRKKKLKKLPGLTGQHPS
jgi:hypothetical protein